MLSRDIISLKEWLDAVRRGEQPFSPQSMAVFSDCLGAAAEAAAGLEAGIMALPPQSVDLDLFGGIDAPNVIILGPRSRRPAFGGES